MKIVSIDLCSDFGFFRKPDTNNTINLSYNMIHKPAVLGLLGAILGLGGYKKKDVLPDYYLKLKDLKIAIEPLMHDKGNFAKTAIKYTNTVGYANKGNNFLTEELTLVKPAYRIYLLLDESNELESKLLEYLKNANAEFVPYFGKNEFTAWWTKESFKEYSFEIPIEDLEHEVAIKSLFLKSMNVKDNKETPYPVFGSMEMVENTFVYFERLPDGFNEELMQYNLEDFAYTNFLIKNSKVLDNLYCLKELDAYVQFI
ncbi:type I-B CRISPR-associated protein Cas5 [Myroides odoratimimus]|uniref:CRISPR-associated protein cas5, subtype I-b/hmari n=1 Tax=Myroides odoratimimus CCUG 10230 TaxID=883150 RepID=A0ABN0EB35_9FLAO|nr:type I-B CRISPR-associated protein Cas5b [Myroides odoratimimus]EHO09810.1 CRISPR-associated protein cas5, subtype I-b/hmari [Myroides odoratimimus CCUG 10230]MDM1039113.1 type I-B CRISPR-associated protein Cas5 [Myroides odoratimimus]MDM1053260.1 type I-B CRISPR-associated protein Cas5 [Myroides odoratimimus]MDM1059703.1 type I-B CRISPR-associated protein Cas5 [Myroides odoratimimus]MDM1085652.1 type I-B CRISPR-associated protein Cas5 [Myroides odoratimimus]